MYVDLNQIRAGEARSPREAQHSSIAMRLAEPDTDGETAGSWLAPLSLAADQLGDVPCTSGRRASDKGLLSMTLDEYTRILMWTAAQGDTRSGAPMPEAVEKSIRELAIVPDEWLDAVTRFPKLFRRIAGSSAELARRAAKAGRRWFHGSRHAARVFQ